MPPKVEDIELVDLAPDFSGPEMKAALGQQQFPLVPQLLTTVVRGVPSKVANALQNVMGGDVPGCCLDFDPLADVETTDPFILGEMLHRRIKHIPLRYNALREDAKFKLYVRNSSTEYLPVRADQIVPDGGKVGQPLFAPTTLLANLAPGATLSIKNIHRRTGRGRAEACMMVATKTYSVPLDLPELPKERTHVGLQGDAQRSGYAVPVLEANPQRFRVGCTILCGNGQAARRYPAEACVHILGRLRTAASVLEAGPSGGQDSTRSFWTKFPEEDEAVLLLHLRGETAVFGTLLEVGLLAANPDCTAVSSLQAHAGELRIRFRAAVPLEDLAQAFLAGIAAIQATIESLREQFEKLA